MYATLKKAQPRALRIIENSINNNRMSHAYLFTGPKGTYKKEMAYHFAMMLYCKQDKPCYECPECKAILENRHMNIYYIEPFGQTIRKEQIIALQEEFSKTSLVPGPRVYIIDSADTMSVSAANSLLKFIEEPVNEETYGILITEHKDNILSTIISRSMVINFEQIDKSLLKEKLVSETENKVLIDCVSVITSNIFDAKKLINDEDFINVFKVFEKYVNQLYSGNPVSLFYRANIDILGQRERLKTFLILLECFYRDIYEYQITKNVLVFDSLKNEISVIASKISSENILKYLFQILELVKKISYNVNINLLINQFLLEMDGGV
jgi:DNA polymerase-3 subunit delta'